MTETRQCVIKYVVHTYQPYMYTVDADANVILFQYLAFPCGLIRGALANLGVVCIVTAEVTLMPACKSFSVGEFHSLTVAVLLLSLSQFRS